jgi:hypothetical protein
MDVHNASRTVYLSRCVTSSSGAGWDWPRWPPRRRWSPARAQSPKRGGTLSVRLWDPPHFDPHLTISYKTHIAYSFTTAVSSGTRWAPPSPRALSPSKATWRSRGPSPRDELHLQAPQGRALAEQGAG